jgi:hypothetical protein
MLGFSLLAGVEEYFELRYLGYCHAPCAMRHVPSAMRLRLRHVPRAICHLPCG